MGCHKLQVSFYKRATNSMALLQKDTNKDKASYASSSPCSDTVGPVVFLCTWHDSLIYVTWLTHTCDTTFALWHHSAATLWRKLISCVCDMTPSYMWNDSLTYVTWLHHACDVTHRRCATECVFVCMTWLPPVCDMILLHMWFESLIHVTSLSSDAVRQSVSLCVWHDSLIYVTRLYYYICDMTASCMRHHSAATLWDKVCSCSCVYDMTPSRMWHVFLICDTSPSYMWHHSASTLWDRVCFCVYDMITSYMWHAFLIYMSFFYM